MTLIAYDALAEESWSRLQHSGDDPNHPMRLLVLATVCTAGAPEARLMVLRGADRRLGKLWFYSDRRSEKIEQLRRQPQVTAVTYDPASGRRSPRSPMTRPAACSCDCGERPASTNRERWRTSTGARLGWPSGRSMPRRTLRGGPCGIDAGGEATARGNFAVIEITVDSIEWLQIADGEQRRAIMFAATNWAVQALAP
jgi:hypothetical protein